MLIGDFQTALGCPTDFDPTCQATALTEDNGLWSGTFPVPPGTYDYQIAALGLDGQQRVYGDGGLDGDPLSVEIGDSDTGAYFSFNPRTEEIRAEPVGAIYTLATVDAEITLVPDGNILSAVVTSQGGEFPYQVVVDGEPLGEQQSEPLEPGLFRLIFDQDGNLTDTEQLTEGTLTITREDSATGACYELRDGDDIVNQACDIDDGDDGATVMSFPRGLEPGNYTLVETVTPDGAETAADADIELTEGNNAVGVAADAGTDDGGDETPAIEGTDVSTDTGDAETPEVTAEIGGEPGNLIVTLQTSEGQPVGGACFELVADNGDVLTEACDTAEAGDGFPDNGNTGFFGIPSATYTLRISDTPDGIEAVDEREVTIEPGTEVAETITATAAEPGETPAPTEPTATDAADQGTGELVVLRTDESGAAVGGACFVIVDENGDEVAPEVCDEDGDVADDGRIGFFDVPAGTWTLRETRAPDGVEPAEDQPVEIRADVSSDLPVQSARLATETPEPTEVVEETAAPTEQADETPQVTATVEAQPGSLIVTLQDEAGQPVGGACFELGGEDGEVAAEACDTDDPFPGNGNTGFFGVPSGTYTLRISETPDNVAAPDDREVEVPAGGEATEIVAVAATEATAEPTEQTTDTETDTVAETGAVEVSFDAAADPAVCVELNTSGGIGLSEAPAACDNGDGDVNDDPGVIVIEDVPAADYTLTVTEGPESLTELEGEPVTVEAGGSAQVAVEVLPPAEPTPSGPESGTLTITVADPEGESLNGACFDVTNESGTVNYCDEDGDGTLIIEEVPFGEQTIVQTAATDGFELATDQTATLSEDEPEATVAITNERGAGLLPVLATDTEGTALPGACWLLIGAEGEFGPLCDDGANGGAAGDGRVTFEQIPAGDYTLREQTPPEGYQPAADVDVAVQSGENDEVAVEHEAAPATVRVTTTGSDGASLVAACYTLDDGDEVCDIDGDGVINFEGVAPGAHTLTQTVPPEGYQEVEDQEVTVEVGQSLIEVGVVNQAATGTVAVNVADDAGEPLNGACATVDDGEPVCDGAANDSFGDEIGRISIAEVSTGDHTVNLTTVPEGYQQPDEAQPVTVEAEATAEVDFALAVVEPATGALEMTIRDAEGAVVPDVCIVLTNAGQGVELGPFCDGGEGDSSGDEGVILVEGIEVGTYTASLSDDSEAQIPDFQSASTRTVRIEADQTTTGQLVVVIVVEATVGVVEVVTRDIDSGDLLVGACYELRGGGDPIVLCDDDENDQDGTDGVVRRTGIEQGTYTLVQTTTPDAYQTAPDRGDVVVNAAATTRVEVDLQPEEQTGTLVVEKVDPAGALLSGACFEVRQGGALVESVCDATDDSPDNGELTFPPLTAGDYRLVETKAPSRDYRPAAAQTVSIAEGEETRVRVVNRPRPGRVEIITVDAADPDQRLTDACFELRGERKYGGYCDGDDLAVDGRVIFENVAAGEYTMVETVSPPGFDGADERTITVSPGSLTQLTVQNAATPPPPERGRLIVYKQDGERQELPGGCFRLFDGDRSVVSLSAMVTSTGSLIW
ncbi:MAG: hypothetical protein H0U28_10620 [Nocardioidaceae bacterium]|nr:hypothetical protein [Nocardioidaceae bacterium]